MMKAKHLIIYMLAAGITANVTAAPNQKPPPEPQDVSVVNDTTNPVPVTVQNPGGEKRFVGFSDDIVLGDVGILGMHTACQNKYGPDSRMCITDEVFKTTNLVAVPGVRGWVAPQLFSNDAAAASASCYRWTNTSGTGYVVLGDTFGIVADNCYKPYPVACCD